MPGFSPRANCKAEILQIAPPATQITTSFIAANIIEYTKWCLKAQPAALKLLRHLCNARYETLLETNGSLDIGPVDQRVVKIVDFKCPSSRQSHANRWQNVEHLTDRDDVKFLIVDRNDYEFARDSVLQHKLIDKCMVIFSPVFGMDKEGPTAVLKSAAKISTAKSHNHLLNQKFLPSALEGDMKEVFIDYIRSWGELDISQIQFNVVDQDTLLEAQENPHLHADLLVRVAGYSADFTGIGKTLQDEIIARTEGLADISASSLSKDL